MRTTAPLDALDTLVLPAGSSTTTTSLSATAQLDALGGQVHTTGGGTWSVLEAAQTIRCEHATKRGWAVWAPARPRIPTTRTPFPTPTVLSPVPALTALSPN